MAYTDCPLSRALIPFGVSEFMSEVDILAELVLVHDPFSVSLNLGAGGVEFGPLRLDDTMLGWAYV